MEERRNSTGVMVGATPDYSPLCFASTHKHIEKERNLASATIRRRHMDQNSEVLDRRCAYQPSQLSDELSP